MRLQPATFSFSVGLIILAVASCSTQTPTVDIKPVCLPMTVYSLPDQQEFAKEVNGLDPQKDAQIIRFLGDYHAMRVADLVCQSK